MKKLLTSILATFILLSLNVAANASGFGLGISISSNTLDTAGKEDVDNNGTIDDRKTVSDDIMIGSVFGEYSATGINGSKLALTIGVDYIPFDADIDKRSITQSSLKALADGAASTGTNSVSATVEDHYTVYLQPGFMINDSTTVYGTIGFSNATVNGKSVSLTHTDINKSQDLDGTVLGAGMKTVKDNGLFIKLDYKETSYDSVSFTTSNNTKATADLDNETFALSIGKQF
jgi:opacity protein-like surface antigen